MLRNASTKEVRKHYRQVARENGDKGLPESEIRDRALRYVAAKAARGAVLTVGYAFSRKTGNLFLTVALVQGSQVFQTPNLDWLAATMGAVTAARWLIECSRMYCKRGSVAYDEQQIRACEHLDEADYIH